MNIHDVKRYVEYLCRLEDKVDSNKFLLLVLIWKQDVASYNRVKRQKGKLGIVADDITYLLEIGYLQQISPPKQIQSFKPDDFKVTKKFLNLVSIDASDAFKELLEIYPSLVLINNNTPVSSKVITLDEGRKIYNEIINQDRLLHYKIVEIINHYKLHFGVKYAPCNIRNFINTKQWETWEELIKDKIHGDNTEMLGNNTNKNVIDNSESL